MVADLKAALDRRFGIQDYLIWSTVIAAVMFVPLHGSFQLGYAIVILNVLALLALDRFRVHRNHLLAICALAGFTTIGALTSGTPLNAPASQIAGISLLSVYFFCVLTVLGQSLVRWMEMYMRVAFAVAIIGLAKWAVGFGLQVSDTRLTSLYSEPSYFIYITLPAFGYCANLFARERRYGGETLVFLLSYVLANSTLGFFGLLLIGLLVCAPRLRGWHVISSIVATGLIMAGIYVASTGVRQRMDELATAVVKQDLTATGNTTFAFLSNVYVTSQSFQSHPLMGIGLGGYAHAYDKFIDDVTGIDITQISAAGGGGERDLQNSMELNRDDAASMFLRITAELGLPGLLLLIGFLVVCARVRGEPYMTIRNALLPYLIVRMTRMGHYFTVELYFFAGIYLLNYLNYRAERGQNNLKEKIGGEYA